MLSAESAAGSFPVETVEIMSRIVEKTEKHKLYRPIVEATEPMPSRRRRLVWP